MGDRGNIFVTNGEVNDRGLLDGVYLYTHWGGSGISRVAATALDSRAGRGRWGDHSYLTRSIFDHLAGYYKGESPSETGFGISCDIGGNDNPIVVVDCGLQRVRLASERLERNPAPDEQWVSFQEFIGKFLKEAS